MNLNSLKNVVTSKAGRQILILQKHSPTILFGAGIVGVVATAVLASRATMQLEGLLISTQKDLQTLDEIGDRMTEDDQLKTKTLIYTKSVLSITKLYAPAVIVGFGSIAALTGSHHIMSKRNAGIMAAYATLEKGFDQYRARVLEDVGAEKDREYRYGVEKAEVVTVDAEGKKRKVVEKHVSSGDPSVYSKFFDEFSTSWSKQPEYNLLFLRCQQNYFNDKLVAKGHVFLNEVYDELGIDRTKEGSVVGWVYNSDEGDNFIDLGIFDKKMEPKHLDFFTGREQAILLDFNVDGVIYDKI